MSLQTLSLSHLQIQPRASTVFCETICAMWQHFCYSAGQFKQDNHMISYFTHTIQSLQMLGTKKRFKRFGLYQTQGWWDCLCPKKKLLWLILTQVTECHSIQVMPCCQQFSLNKNKRDKNIIFMWRWLISDLFYDFLILSHIHWVIFTIIFDSTHQMHVVSSADSLPFFFVIATAHYSSRWKCESRDLGKPHSSTGV